MGVKAIRRASEIGRSDTVRSFLIRLQVNSISGREPNSETYNHVHTRMAEMGAIQTIVAANGAYYATPHATYILVSDDTTTAIRGRVAAEIERIWPYVDTLVLRYDEAAWKLTETKPAPQPRPLNGLFSIGALLDQN